MKITKEKIIFFLNKFNLIFFTLVALFILLRILFHYNFNSLDCFREETLFYCPNNDGKLVLNFVVTFVDSFSSLILNIIGILSIVNLILSLIKLKKDLKITGFKNVLKTKNFYNSFFYLVISIYFMFRFWSCYWTLLFYPGYCLAPF